MSELAQLRAARASRRFETMFRLAHGLIERSGHPAARRAVAKTLTEMDRHEEAAPHWRALVDANANDVEAVFQVAAHGRRLGLSSDAAIAAADRAENTAFRGHLWRALESKSVSVRNSLEHVAICGVSFCGSTLLDRLLGGLPNTRSIGESHWLTKIYDGHGYVPLDPSRHVELRRPACTVCGPDCAVLTSEFRFGLALDSSRWYSKIGEQLGTTCLVSADKNLPKLIDNDPLLRFTALVLFKSPEQAWASQRAKLPADRDEAFYAQELERYLAVWEAAYRGFLDEFDPIGGKYFFFFDAFTRSPQVMLAKLCAILRLPFDSSILQHTKPGHAIGGNARTMGRLREAGYGVEIEPLRRPQIPAQDIRLIRRNAAIRSCFRDLLSRFYESAPSDCPRTTNWQDAETGELP